MFDLGWSELLLIGIVAVVVLGPKELPQAMRMLGGLIRKARTMSAELHRHMDDLVRDSELQDLKDQAHRISPAAINLQARALLDPDGSVQNAVSLPPSPLTSSSQVSSSPAGLPPITPAAGTSAQPSAPSASASAATPAPSPHGDGI